MVRRNGMPPRSESPPGYDREQGGQARDDDNCHGADALRTAADGLPLVTGMSLSRYSSFSHPGPLRRRVRGIV